MNLSEFATEKYPLRPSKLDRLVKCEMFGVLSSEMEDELGGAPAQTGNVVHEMVAAFHREPETAKKVQAGLAVMASSLAKFPDADPNEVRLFYTPYSADPRNLYARFASFPTCAALDSRSIGGSVYAIEYPVVVRLPAHSLDPTGMAIVVRGTLDQLRINPDTGDLEVWDLKTGKPDGWEMIHRYALQQAAYTLAARQSGFPNAKLGGLIRNHGYRKRGSIGESPDGVFWRMPWSVAACETLLDKVRLSVAMIRRGEINFGPGFDCGYCQFGGLQGCMPLAEEKFKISLV